MTVLDKNAGRRTLAEVTLEMSDAPTIILRDDGVIFDLTKIADRATYEQPVLTPVGIDRVIVGGETAVKDGELVRSDLGRSVRR